ncbi:MAG: hypothetical protein AAF318_19955 [Pseudomonadota bacterium]
MARPFVQSAFANLECALLDRHKSRAKTEARVAIFAFIEGWHNPGRQRSALGYLSPTDDEMSALEMLASSCPQPSTKPGELQLHFAAIAMVHHRVIDHAECGRFTNAATKTVDRPSAFSKAHYGRWFAG